MARKQVSPEDLDEAVEKRSRPSAKERAAARQRKENGQVPNVAVAPEDTAHLDQLDEELVEQVDPQAAESDTSQMPVLVDKAGGKKVGSARSGTSLVRPAEDLVEVDCTAEDFLLAVSKEIADEIMIFSQSDELKEEAGKSYESVLKVLTRLADGYRSLTFSHEYCRKVGVGSRLALYEGKQVEQNYRLSRWMSIRGGRELVPDRHGKYHPSAACCFPHRYLAIEFNKRIKSLNELMNGLITLAEQPFSIEDMTTWKRESDKHGPRPRASTDSQKALSSLSALSKLTAEVASELGAD